MRTSGQRGWFRGDTLWYHRAVIYLLQSFSLAVVLGFLFDSWGYVVAGVVSVFLLFRQVRALVTTELGGRSVE